MRVIPAVRAASVAIAAAAELCADRLARGGRLVFVGAGTSGRIAAAEAAELPGTFGLARDRVGAMLVRRLGPFTAAQMPRAVSTASASVRSAKRWK